MSGSYDEASLAPEETTDSFWEVRLCCSPGPGGQTAWLCGGPGPHPVALGLAAHPLGLLQSTGYQTGSSCYEVTAIAH